jgi:integrase
MAAMGRSADLKPSKVKSREKLGLSPWCLSVPPHLSPTGKRQRTFYSTKADAELEAEKLKVRKDNFGISLSTLSPARMAEASEAYKLLGDEGSLLEAVKGFLAVHRQRSASITFLELFNRFIGAKADRNGQYLRELRFTRDRFPTLHSRLVSDLSSAQLEPLLMAISPGGRNPVMRYLRAVFNYGIKRGFLSENPIAKLDFAERPRREVETLSNGQVKAMLEHALEHDIELLPFLVLGVFCGIRPDGELQKLAWSDIDLNDQVVTIRPEVSKTRRRRFVDLSDNAKAWLESFIARAGIRQGRVAKFGESELRTKRTANWQAAGIKIWPQQGMRHTYCSNWLAMHKDVNKLVLQSGHDSVDTMWRHYHRGTTEADAKAFWAIEPKKQERSSGPRPNTRQITREAQQTHDAGY